MGIAGKPLVFQRRHPTNNHPDCRAYSSLVEQWAMADPGQKGESTHAPATIYVYVIARDLRYVQFPPQTSDILTG